MEGVRPVVATLAGRHPGRTLFTRFIPPEGPDEMPGHVATLLRTLARRDPRMPRLRLLELMPPPALLECFDYLGV